MDKPDKTRCILAFCAAVALSVGSSAVMAKDLKIKLTGAEETPPVTTSATGTGTIIIKKDKSISGSFTTTGIDGTMAHIHQGAVGQAGPPIITLSKGEHGEWSVPPGIKLTDEQYAAYKAGDLYINVHSAAHMPGEIRAQLKP